MKRTRRRIDSALKAKIALEALRGQTSVSELAQQYGLHPNQIYAWKKQLENYAVYVFDRHTRELAELEAKVSGIASD
jgi:transposase